jgi:hypothetical protein
MKLSAVDKKGLIARGIYIDPDRSTLKLSGKLASGLDCETPDFWYLDGSSIHFLPAANGGEDVRVPSKLRECRKSVWVSSFRSSRFYQCSDRN